MIKEYMMLGFSYMSFVIKNKIEENDDLVKLNKFDIEPYNYIYNKRSSFLDSKFVYDDYITLQNVLENCKNTNILILDELAYGSPY